MTSTIQQHRLTLSMLASELDVPLAFPESARLAVTRDRIYGLAEAARDALMVDCQLTQVEATKDVADRLRHAAGLLVEAADQLPTKRALPRREIDAETAAALAAQVPELTRQIDEVLAVGGEGGEG